MSCPVCKDGERFLLAETEDRTIMGFLSDTEQYPCLELYISGKFGADDGVTPVVHRQVMTTCPVCGEQVCSDEAKEEVVSFYEHIHDQRIRLREGLNNEGSEA